MTTLGNSEQWHDLLDSLVPDIVNLILAAWATMPLIAPDAKEDPISEELCRRLRAARGLSELPLQVHTQLVELDSEADVEQGRIDIVFLPFVPDESIYFALECKRVNVRQVDGTICRYFAEYVTHGLRRFVTGQYSHAVRHGGMLAFVLNGDVDAAIAGILKNIEDKRDVLQLIGIHRSRHIPADPNLRETSHTRSANPRDIVVQHFFMPSPTASDAGGT